MAIVALMLSLAAPGCEHVIEGRTVSSYYFEAVAQYREGATRASVLRFGALERADVENVLARLEQTAGKFQHRDTRRPDDDCLRAASLLHLEAGRQAADDLLWAASIFHLDSGWRLTDLFSSTDTRIRFQRDWLLAAGLAYQASVFTGSSPDRAFTEADRYLAAAATRYPVDPEVLLAQGALLEWAGSLPWGDPAHLKEAESLYRRLLAIDPQNAEGMVRYGWTLKRLKKDREAVEILERVPELPTEDNLIYRSRMGLGGLAEQAQLYDEAITHYQEALRLLPRWQVGHLALSHALHVSGAHERARDVLETALRLDRSRAALDDWWSYELGLVPRLEPLLARMRAQVTK